MLAIASIAIWSVFKGFQGPLPDEIIRKELRALKAEGQVKKLQAEANKEEALNQVKQDYASELQQLDEKQAKKAKELEDDPSKLAKFAIKAARS